MDDAWFTAEVQLCALHAGFVEARAAAGLSKDKALDSRESFSVWQARERDADELRLRARDLAALRAEAVATNITADYFAAAENAGNPTTSEDDSSAISMHAVSSEAPLQSTVSLEAAADMLTSA